MNERTWIFRDGATMTSHYALQLFNRIQLFFTAQNAKFQTFADLVNFFRVLKRFKNNYYSSAMMGSRFSHSLHQTHGVYI